MKREWLIGGALVVALLCWRASAAAGTDAAGAWAALGKGALLVDTRSAGEFKAGHLEGALNIPHDEVGRRLAEFGTDKARPIVVYCRSGRRSGLAKAELEKQGFTAVINGGGYDQMKAARPSK